MTQEEIKNLYLELGIDTKNLGCVMLEVNPLKVSDVVPEDELYFSENMTYAQGIVCEWGLPHVTLLYGLMQNAQDWKEYVDQLLDGINLSSITIDRVDTFDNEDEGVEYSCFIAKVKVTDELLKANDELRKLPHIDSFPDYVPHITLFYAKRNDEIKASLLSDLNDRFAGKKVTAEGLIYD